MLIRKVQVALAAMVLVGQMTAFAAETTTVQQTPQQQENKLPTNDGKLGGELSTPVDDGSKVSDQQGQQNNNQGQQPNDNQGQPPDNNQGTPPDQKGLPANEESKGNALPPTSSSSMSRGCPTTSQPPIRRGSLTKGLTMKERP